jgi:hypothetical protein
MSRILVVGPGPFRVNHAPHASIAASELADRLRAEGHDIVVVDSSPSSALLWTSHRRYLEPLDPSSIARIVSVESVDEVVTAPAPAEAPDPNASGTPLAVAPAATKDVHATAAWLARREAARLARPIRIATDGAVDFTAAFFEFARAREREAPPGSVEIHVLVMTDGERARVLGTFEHVEHAPVHADDAAAVFPSLAAPENTLRAAEEESMRIAVASGARGVVTVRWAIAAELVMLGIVGGITSHALSLGLVTGVDLVAESVRIALGDAVDTTPAQLPRHVAVEEHVFPFADTGASDTRLDRGPFSTGSVLAIGDTVERAYLRALSAMGVSLARPRASGEAAVLLAGGDEHASALADVGRRFFALGFEIVATEEAARWLTRMRIRHRAVSDAPKMIAAREVVAVVAATSREQPEARAELRRAALLSGVPCFTTIDLTRVAVRALEQEANDLPRALDDWIPRYPSPF